MFEILALGLISAAPSPAASPLRTVPSGHSIKGINRRCLLPNCWGYLMSKFELGIPCPIYRVTSQCLEKQPWTS